MANLLLDELKENSLVHFTKFTVLFICSFIQLAFVACLSMPEHRDTKMNVMFFTLKSLQSLTIEKQIQGQYTGR